MRQRFKTSFPCLGPEGMIPAGTEVHIEPAEAERVNRKLATPLYIAVGESADSDTPTTKRRRRRTTVTEETE